MLSITRTSKSHNGKFPIISPFVSSEYFKSFAQMFHRFCKEFGNVRLSSSYKSSPVLFHNSMRLALERKYSHTQDEIFPSSIFYKEAFVFGFSLLKNTFPLHATDGTSNERKLQFGFSLHFAFVVVVSFIRSVFFL